MANPAKQIRKSTAEFLIFASQSESDTIEVRLEDDTLWLTQQLMAQLFDTTKQNISLHIQNIITDNELDEKNNCQGFLDGS